MSIKSGFTLAELILTLTIVGVIAAMTIPDMVQNIQNAQSNVSFKRIFSEITSASRLLSIDASGTLKGYFTSEDDMLNKYGKYLRFIKTCPESQEFTGGCWFNNTTILAKRVNGETITDWGGEATAILPSGALINFLGNDLVNCNPNCGRIAVDVNGFKPPNVIGKDIFSFYILPDGTRISIDAPSTEKVLINADN